MPNLRVSFRERPSLKLRYSASPVGFPAQSEHTAKQKTLQQWQMAVTVVLLISAMFPLVPVVLNLFFLIFVLCWYLVFLVFSCASDTFL